MKACSHVSLFKLGHGQNETLAKWPFRSVMAECLVYVSMSGQSVHDIRG